MRHGMKRELKPFIALFLICGLLILFIFVMTKQVGSSENEDTTPASDNVAYYQPLLDLQKGKVQDQVGFSAITTEQMNEVHLTRALQYEVAKYNNALYELHQAKLAQEEAARKAAIIAENKAAAPVVASNYASGGTVWDRLQKCECPSGWHCNTGNGYYGGLQFNISTWRAYGGTGYPHEHSREGQIAVAERLRADRGFQPWPACSRKLGLR